MTCTCAGHPPSPRVCPVLTAVVVATVMRLLCVTVMQEELAEFRQTWEETEGPLQEQEQKEDEQRYKAMMQDLQADRERAWYIVKELAKLPEVRTRPPGTPVASNPAPHRTSTTLADHVVPARSVPRIPCCGAPPPPQSYHRMRERPRGKRMLSMARTRVADCERVLKRANEELEQAQQQLQEMEEKAEASEKEAKKLRSLISAARSEVARCEREVEAAEQELVVAKRAVVRAKVRRRSQAVAGGCRVRRTHGSGWCLLGARVRPDR